MTENHLTMQKKINEGRGNIVVLMLTLQKTLAKSLQNKFVVYLHSKGGDIMCHICSGSTSTKQDN